MPKETELVCVIDRSGSMASTRDDAEGGFNNFISEQRKLNLPCMVTVHQFDNTFETVWERQPLRSAPYSYSLVPRGNTALNDAIGKTIARILREHSIERNVIVVIVTDGQENASTDWSTTQIKKLVELKQLAGWSFVFIGAGIDAFSESRQRGVHYGSTISVGATHDGLHTAYAVTDHAVTRARVTGTAVNFTEEEQTEAMATVTDYGNGTTTESGETE